MIAPLAVVSYAVSIVYFQRLSDLKHKNQDFSLEQLKAWKTLSLIAFPLMIFLFFFMEDMITVILGEEWLYSATIILHLLPLMAIRFIFAPSTMIFVILDRLHFNLIFSIVGLLVRSGSIIFGYMQDDLLIGLKIWVFLECLYVFTYCIIGYKLSSNFKTNSLQKNS